MKVIRWICWLLHVDLGVVLHDCRGPSPNPVLRGLACTAFWGAGESILPPGCTGLFESPVCGVPPHPPSFSGSFPQGRAGPWPHLSPLPLGDVHWWKTREGKIPWFLLVPHRSCPSGRGKHLLSSPLHPKGQAESVSLSFCWREKQNIVHILE